MLNSVVALACETARSGYGALVFAGSRARCEADALIISRAMPSWDNLCSEVIDKRIDLLGEFRSLSTGIDSVLERTIPFGVAFHREDINSLKFGQPYLFLIADTNSDVRSAPH